MRVSERQTDRQTDTEREKYREREIQRQKERERGRAQALASTTLHYLHYLLLSPYSSRRAATLKYRR